MQLLSRLKSSLASLTGLAALQREQTPPQSTPGGAAISSPLAQLPGFASAANGTYATYREISRHPTVAEVMQIVKGPIASNAWNWRAKAGAPGRWLEFVRVNLEPMRPQIVRDALQALEMGWKGFEAIFAEENGRIVLSKLKPLLQDKTEIVVDAATGSYQGLRQQDVTLPTEKTFVYSCDGQDGDYYGRSRHENIRTDWCRSMEVAHKLAQYLNKIAGVTIQMHYPEGTSKDAAGADRPNFWIAQDILNAAAAGRSVALPNRFSSMITDGLRDGLLTGAAIEKALASAGRSEWVLSAFDPGGADYSRGFLDALAYFDKRLFRGWLRPERSGLEADRGGSRADSEQHSETGLLDSQLVDQDLAHQFSQQVINNLLVLNFGSQARNAVWIEPASLSTDATLTNQALLAALLADPAMAATLAGKVDLDQVLADMGIPVRSRA